MHNFKVSASRLYGDLHGKVIIDPTNMECTNRLVHIARAGDMCWDIEGIFQTQLEAALAIRDHLGFKGTVWGVEDFHRTVLVFDHMITVDMPLTKFKTIAV